VSDDEMAEAVGDSDAARGMAFDEQSGDIYVPERRLTCVDSVAMAAGLAHENRPAPSLHNRE
jgi:hypothetical protein